MHQHSSPPRFAHRFFRWYCHPRLLSHIEGDLIEVYRERVTNRGKWAADIRFVIDVLLLLRPAIIRPFENRNVNIAGMYKSYVKVGWRNILRNKGYSFINIGGLALGMSVAMLIGLWVFDELYFNRHFTNHDTIVQFMKAGDFDGRKYTGQQSLPYPLIDELKNSYSENFTHIVPASWRWDGVLNTGEKKITRKGIYFGEAAPEMFTWEMVHGNWNGLYNTKGIMISESTSEALFGDEAPINKILNINGGAEAIVTGVYRDFPKNTELYGIQFVQPWEFLLIDAAWIKRQDWQNHFLQIYGQIAPNTTLEQVAVNIKDAEARAIKDLDYMQEHLKYNFEVRLHPMRDWHLFSNFTEGVLENGPAQLVWFISAIGAFVLLLACINFMNLSTARSEKRAKEVGIRKTMGSFRGQLVSQFFSESFIVVILAFAVAMLIVAVALPGFNQLAVKEIAMPFNQPWFWLCGLGFICVTGFLAGSYPALYLSAFKPVAVLKGIRLRRGGTAIRKTLVVIQFSVSVVLIICTGVIYHQLMYVKDRPVGYSREGLIMISKKHSDFDKNRDVIRTGLLKTGAVTEVAESGGQVTDIWSSNGGFNWEGKDPAFEASFATLNVSHDFGKTVGWKFTDGRDFDKTIASDSFGFVLNEAAVKYMGITNPVDKTVHWTNRAWGMDNDFRVLGVIKDMIMGSPFEPAQPSIYFVHGYKRMLLARLTPGKSISEALPAVESVFNQLTPEVPFDFKFADDEFAIKFANEERIGRLAALFAGLAIIISCLGLLGLISFVAERRTKEIGIRKVLGASVLSIWHALSREFILLVTISCMIAAPLSWYILKKGLSNYEYRTDIGWWIFALAAFGAIAITLITVSFQAIKAAMVNPVKSLRSE
jgi:hypothetical protein